MLVGHADPLGASGQLGGVTTCHPDRRADRYPGESSAARCV